MAFYVGQKVVCVDGVGPHRGGCKVTLPVQGRVYTIRAVCQNPETGRWNCALIELVNPPVCCIEGTGEPYFGQSRFAPVVERKTDISIFTKMLTPDRVDA